MRKHNKRYCDETVQFPKEPSEILDNGKLEMIHTFEFQEGGWFLHAENITDKHQKDILLLLSQYVTYSLKAASHNDSKGSCKNVYHAVPDVLMEIAEGSCLDSCYQLLEHACCHAMDAKNPSLYCGNGKICELRGEKCFLINGNVHASMKEQCYDCTAAVSHCGIVACKCNCKAGSICDNWHVDIHTVGHLQNLTILLFDGLAENMLIELAAEWSTRDPEYTNEDERVEVIHAIQTLKGVAGLMVTSASASANTSRTQTLAEMLVDFTVSTKQAKLSLPSPKESEIIPFHDISVESIGKQVTEHIESAKEKAKLSKESEQAPQPAEEELPQEVDPASQEENQESESQTARRGANP